MRKINTSPISVTAGMPIKKGTIQHLQLAYQEGLDALSKAIIGGNYNSSDIYILSGLVLTSNVSDYTISSGSVYFQGEIFIVDQVTLPAPTGGNSWIAKIVTSQYTTFADPVQFQGGGLLNVHDIRKISISVAATGTGVGEYDAFKRILSDPMSTRVPTYIDISFDGNYVNIPDLQSYSSGFSFSYLFVNPIVGAKTNLIIGLTNSPTSINFDNSFGDYLTLLPKGVTRPFSVSDATGSKPLCITFEYMGFESTYGNHIIKVDIHQTA